MRTLGLLILATAVASTDAIAQRTVDQRRRAWSDGTVKISSTAGSIRVVGWDRDTVAITGTLGDGVERLEFRTDERATRINVVPTRIELEDPGTAAWRALSSDLEIHVPRRSYVAVRTVGATIEISDVTGGVDLESESGDIHVTSIPRVVRGRRREYGPRSIYAESAGGDITIDAPTKIVRARSVDGAVKVTQAYGFAEISTISGNAELTGQLTQGKVSTVSGDIRFEGGFERGSFGFSFETHSGSIELRFPSDISADFDVTAIHGRVENDFAPASSSTFTSGSGGTPVRVHSFKGRVSILKRR